MLHGCVDQPKKHRRWKKKKTSQRKTRKPGDGSGMNVEIDGLVRLALLDGSGAVVFWQRMARSIARASAMFFLIKNTFSGKSIFIWFAQFRVLCLFKPSRVFYLRLSF